MQIGIVGKPSVGKSTFFKAATLAEVDIASYPFTTIKPNVAVGYVKVECADKEFNTQCNPREGFCIEHNRFVPVQLIDVAGLVPGAHEGKGMGNQFLDDLRQADALIHIIDISGSTNEKGESVEPGSYDPANDIKFLEHELDMWYVSILKKGWEKFARQIQQEKKEIQIALAKQLSGLKVTEEMVEDAISKLNLNKESPASWNEEELFNLAKELRNKTKPMVIACNKIDSKVSENNFNRLKTQFPNHILVPTSAESELALREAAKHNLIKYIPGESTFEIIAPDKLEQKQQLALSFIKQNILEKYHSTGVQKTLDASVFDLLKYIAIFPGGVNNLTDRHGNTLPDCFLLPPGTTPLSFAYYIHSDIGDKYVKAINVKTKLPIAKDHLLEHGDVIEIKTSN